MESWSVVSMSYHRPEDQRILNAVLRTWFRSPKDLNLTDPRMPYPFSMTKWIKLSYLYPGATTLVCKDSDWIVGHASYKPRRPGHFSLFHFIIDPRHRGQGIGGWFLDRILEQLRQNQAFSVALRVSPKNPVAIRLYESRGFCVIGSTPQVLTMESTFSDK